MKTPVAIEVWLWFLRLLFWSVAFGFPLFAGFGPLLATGWLLIWIALFVRAVVWPADLAQRQRNRQLLRFGPLRCHAGWLAVSAAAAIALNISSWSLALRAGLPSSGASDFISKALSTPSLATVLLAVFVAPFVEEYIFRGGILPALIPALRTHGAVIATALLFAALHLDSAGFPGRTAGGVVMGYSVVYSGSLWPAVAMHVLNNAVAFVLISVPTKEPHLSLAPAVAAACLSLALLVYALRRIRGTAAGTAVP